MNNENIKSLAVLLTCHNRVELTLECLRLFYEQTALTSTTASVYLVDDGSSDGTSRAVKEAFPDVNLIIGDGSLYWNQGMRVAFSAALVDSFDYYLWLNDDTRLYRCSLDELLKTSEQLHMELDSPCVVIAAAKDSRTGVLSYGGYRRRPSILSKLKFELADAEDKPVQVEGMCGNCVLIPREVVEVVGNISACYRHRWGDIDYSLRALEKGYLTWVAPGFLAECDANPHEDRWRNKALPFVERFQELNSLKGLGGKDWYNFVRRHGGLLWPLDWIRPYIRLLVDSIR